MKSGNGKRKFSELREIILRALAHDQKTINQLSSETGINWRTISNHLVYLVGRGLAKEVFSSRFVRIFEITEKGLMQIGIKASDKLNSQFEQSGEVKIK